MLSLCLLVYGTRQKMQPTMTDLLKKLICSNNAVSISKDWVMAGRPCSPRLLFVFEGCRVPEHVEDSTSGSRSHRQVNSLSLGLSLIPGRKGGWRPSLPRSAPGSSGGVLGRMMFGGWATSPDESGHMSDTAMSGAPPFLLCRCSRDNGTCSQVLSPNMM